MDTDRPTIAAVNGAVRAGGIGLMASCDLVVVDRSVTFALTEVRIGVAAAIISVPILRRVPSGKIAAAMLTGEVFDADEARAVAQETFLRVYASLDRYDERRDFVNWLYRIARNLAIDLLRRRRRHALPVDDVEGAAGARGSEDVADDLRSAETGRLVREVLATLPVEYRTALTLRDLHGMSPREIAAVTDCTYPTARWRIHRARALFREAWDERVGPAPIEEPTS